MIISDGNLRLRSVGFGFTPIRGAKDPESKPKEAKASPEIADKLVKVGNEEVLTREAILQRASQGTKELEASSEVRDKPLQETSSVPLNPYEYAKKYKTGFFLVHGPHDPFDAFRLAKISAQRNVSFEVDGFKGEITGKEAFVNAHPPVFYKAHHKPFPSENNLALISPYNYINILKNSKAPVKFDFKSEEAIDEMARLASLIPKERRMGHMFLWELTNPKVLEETKDPNLRALINYENFTLDQLAEAKRKLGNVPFVVSARGVTKEMVMDKNYLDYVGRTLKGKAEIVEFNLPNNDPPPPETVKYLWEKYGLMCEVKVRSPEEKLFWLEFAKREKVPFIGLVEDPKLATPGGTPPEEDYQRTKALVELRRGSQEAISRYF